MCMRERERGGSRRGERKNNSSIACYRELLRSKKLDEGKLFITSLKRTAYIRKRELFTYDSHDLHGVSELWRFIEKAAAFGDSIIWMKRISEYFRLTSRILVTLN